MTPRPALNDMADRRLSDAVFTCDRFLAYTIGYVKAYLSNAMIIKLCIGMQCADSTKGLGQCAFYAPSVFKPRCQAVIRHPQKIRPIHQAHCLSKAGQYYIISLVPVLKKLRCPDAVLGAVIAIVVLALYGVLATWPASHIGQKFRKGIPSFADRNPTSAVMFEHQITGIGTSASHCSPRFIFDCSGQSVLMPQFSPEASATSGVSSRELGCRDVDFRSAVAMTKPFGPTPFARWQIRNDGQSTKSLAAQILEIISASCSLTLSHDMTFLIKGGCG